MHLFNAKISRSVRARLQATLQETMLVPGGDFVASFVARLGRHRRRRALAGSARIQTIVVGSQTFGGAGKTPVCLHLAHCLSPLASVGMLLRPTRRDCRFEGRVSSEAEAFEAGDEAFMVWSRLPPGAALFVARELARGQVMAQGAVECLIIDDGLRRPDLRSDLSIVVIDHGASSAVFPRGPCREDDTILSACDLVWLNKVNEPSGRGHVEASIRSRYEPLHLVNRRGDTLPLDTMRHVPVTVVSGIGRPGSFYHTLQPFLNDVVQVLEYGDHEPFEFPEAERDGEIIVTTEKDLARMPGNQNVWALCIKLVIESGAQALDERLMEFVP